MKHSLNSCFFRNFGLSIIFFILFQVSDDAIEVIAEQIRGLRYLDLSWCPRVSDAALEYIACDLSDTLNHLILDR